MRRSVHRVAQEPTEVPLYEYQCKQCGHRFEKIQSFSAPPETECPQCHGEVERLISAPAIQFKGSGWYATDYASKSGAKGAQKSDAESAAKPEGSAASSNAAPSSTPASAAPSASASTEKK
jgi:putative FmdB family regulatory protein